MNRHASKTTIHSIARTRYLKRMFSEIPAGFVVVTSGFNKDGELETDSLKSRGYTFAKSDAIMGNNVWFKDFSTEIDADSEIDTITE